MPFPSKKELKVNLREQLPSGVTLSDEAEEILNLVVYESFSRRGREWIHKLVFTSAEHVTIGAVNSRLRRSLNQLISGRYRGRSMPLSSIDILEAIHENWYRVWPFCK